VKNIVIGIVVLILLVFSGWFLFGRGKDASNELVPEPTVTPAFEPIGDEVDVEFEPNKARTKAMLTISGLDRAGVESIEYEVLYETSGLVKGVNSGGSPIEVEKTGIVEKELDFGTCSSGVCRYDKDVGTITLIIRFNTSSGTKIFKQEYN